MPDNDEPTRKAIVVEVASLTADLGPEGDWPDAVQAPVVQASIEVHDTKGRDMAVVFAEMRDKARARDLDRQTPPLELEEKKRMLDAYVPPIDVSGFQIRGIRIIPEARPETQSILWRLAAHVPSRDPGEIIEVHGAEEIPIMALERMPKEAVIEIIRRAILSLLEHELDEQLKVDGKQWRDPHGGQRR